MPEELASEAGRPRNCTRISRNSPICFCVERVLGRFRTGEVTHQQRESVIFPLQARGERDHLVDAHAEAVYAGIDMNGRAAVPLRAGDETVPFGEFYQAADHRPRVDLGEGRAAAGQRAIQHIDRGVLHCRTQPARLGRDRRRKTSCSRL